MNGTSASSSDDTKRTGACAETNIEHSGKRRKTLSDLSAIRGMTKTALSATLQKLNDAGYLNDSLVKTPTLGQYRRGVRSAVEMHGFALPTPYGPMIQEMDLPSESMPKWHYINPFALINHLCRVVPLMFNLLLTAMHASGGLLKIIIYIDEINPGNALHPNPERLLQAVYWTFVDLPSWFLQRKDAWFTFGLLRTKITKELGGGISELCKLILHIFFPRTGHSWTRGCCVQHDGEAKMLVAEFGGFLADEKGLKEIFDIKGQAGSVPCWNCLNVRNRWVATDGHAKFKFWEPCGDNVIKMTDAHLEEKIRRLEDCSGPLQQQVATRVGINYAPRGLLFCHDTRTRIMKPLTNYIRDWMHTLMSNGVAGTQLALLCQALLSVGCGLSVVRTYAKQFNNPRARGKVNNMFFKDELMCTDHVRHFASDVLGMYPLMYAFLVEKIGPRGWLPRHIECFNAMYAIICILRRGSMTKDITRRLKELVETHARLFLDIYGSTSAKIKFHHLYDLADDLRRLGKVVGCFVTERKHKDVIAVTTSLSRHIERTAICSLLQSSLTHWAEHPDACKPMYLVRAKYLDDSQRLARSEEAILPCGTVFAKDMVVLQDGSVAKIVDFWQAEDHDDILVRVEQHVTDNNLPLRWMRTTGANVILHVTSIVEPIAWYCPSSNIVVVAMPVL
jgi:hypothetical protein